MTLLISACVAPPLLIQPEELPTGVEGQPYEEQLAADGAAPYRWTIVDGLLPRGVSLSPSGGIIGGVPAESGTFEFTVRAEDASLPPRRGSRPYALTLLPRLELLAKLEAARVGAPYRAPFQASGGVPPYTFAIVGLPAGLMFDADTGVISGTPLNPYAALRLQVTVADSGAPRQEVTQFATLTVKPRGVTIATAELPAGKVDTPYRQALVAQDGQPPYSWSVEAGVLPDGLRLSLSTGVILGTPTTAAVATVTIQVADSDQPASIASREFTITIEP